MSCWTKPELENMLEDVVNELTLSGEMIEKHGQMGTAPAELVRLVLEEKDRQISMLKRGFKQIELKSENEQLPIHSVVCNYDLAWVGKCGKETTDGYCEEHKVIKCCKCGKQAVKQCEHASQLVCGAPLCGDCKHDH